MSAPSARSLRLPAVALAALAAAACGGAHEPAAPAEKPPLAVTVATAAETASGGALVATATIEPIRRASPGTVLLGRVDRILKREGDAVRSGEALALVESREVAAREAQAEAALDAARAAEQNARAMRERMERLSARQAASRKMLEDATLGHEAALAQVRAAEEGVAAAKVYTGYARVVAPFDGVVAERRVEAGDLAAPGQPLFVVEDTRRVKVEAAVPESAAGTLAKGAPVRVETGGASRDAAIDEVLPSADPRSRTVTVRAVLDNADGALRSGTFARIAFAGAGTEALSVPESSLVRHGPLTGVFVVDGAGVARLRWLSLGAAGGGSVEVLAGLATGERFVASPPAELEDGRRVTSEAGAAR